MPDKLRITASGWENFTGNFGGVDFTDGLSNESLTRRQIDHLAALVRCDLADENGDAVEQGGSSARLVGAINVGDAPSGLRHATQDEIDADRRERLNQSGRAPTPLYTKVELEAIAAKEGLAGLRKIGDAWSVRDRAIGKLVVLILNAQRVFTLRRTETEARTLAGREAAKLDALEKLQKREADLDARAKLANTEPGTSNAIGPDGQNVTMPMPIPVPVLPVPLPVIEPVVPVTEPAVVVEEVPVVEPEIVAPEVVAPEVGIPAAEIVAPVPE